MSSDANGLCSTPIFAAVSIASLSPFYAAAVPDRPFKAVNPSIWTSVAVNMSLMTACVPSIKRLITDWAAGVVNAGVMEPFAIQKSGGTAGSYPRGINSQNFEGSQPSPHGWSRSDRKEAAYSKYVVRRGDNQVRVGSDRDSETRLTDGIMQTIDYRVEYAGDRFSQENISFFRGI